MKPLLLMLLSFYFIPSYSVVFASECEDQITLDKIPTKNFKISLINAIDISDEYHANQSQQIINLSNKKVFSASPLNPFLAIQFDFHRSIELHLKTDQIKNKIIAPFSCEINEITKDPDSSIAKYSGLTQFKAKNELSCPLISFAQHLAGLEINVEKYFTLKSFKYNLGDRFSVTTDCQK